MNTKQTPSILFVYFTYTKQTLKVVEAMSEVLQRRGCDVHRGNRVVHGLPCPSANALPPSRERRASPLRGGRYRVGRDVAAEPRAAAHYRFAPDSASHA